MKNHLFPFYKKSLSFLKIHSAGEKKETGKFIDLTIYIKTNMLYSK